MQEFIDQQIKTKGYTNATRIHKPSDCQDQEKEAQKQLEDLLIEGLDSGEPIEITEKWWENKRNQLVNRFNKEKS